MRETHAVEGAYDIVKGDGDGQAARGGLVSVTLAERCLSDEAGISVANGATQSREPLSRAAILGQLRR